jgi:predicted nucleotidyltransferase component of viral defense system
MIEVLKQAIYGIKETPKQVCKIREELQKLILQAVYDNNYSNNIAFLGGAALRLLHHTNRYSEDLDFSLIKKEKYDFLALIKDIINFFALYIITIESVPNAD